MAIGDVSFVVECRSCKEEDWMEWEFCDLYDDALNCALKAQTEYGDECRIIRYTSLSEEDHGPHKTKIVAVFQPMPGYELQKQREKSMSEKRKVTMDDALAAGDAVIMTAQRLRIEELEKALQEIADPAHTSYDSDSALYALENLATNALYMQRVAKEALAKAKGDE